METDEKILVFTDGGARGNPGPAAAAFVVFKNNKVLFKSARFLGKATNNIAEYTAVSDALKWLLTHRFNNQKIFFRLDSELIVNQLTGVYRVKNPGLKKYYQEIKSLTSLFKEGVFYNHVLRKENSLADKLVNEALDKEKQFHVCQPIT